VKGKSAALKTVKKMPIAAHVIETEQNSIRKGLAIVRVRRLILLGLAVAMALASLAPIVVLAG
jgi:hypothetical protein